MTTLAQYADINPSAGALDRDSNELVAFVPMAAVSEGGRLVSPQIRPMGEVSKGYTYFERNDVLMAKITPCMENGKAALLDTLEPGRGFGSTEFHVLRAKAGVDPRFVFYLVWNHAFRENAAKNMTGTAGQKRVPAGYLKGAQVPDVTRSDQRHIADILDRVDAIRRKRKEAIALTEELLRSTFLEMFGDPVTNPMGWNVKPLGEVIDKLEAGWSANGDARPHDPNEYGVLKISAVTSGVFRPDEHKAVSQDSVDRELVTPRAGDLLFSRANTRELVAATCLVERDEPRLFLPDKIWRVILRTKVASAPYIRFLLAHDRFRGELTKTATGTSGSMLNVSMEKLRALRAPIPPFPIQEQFARVVWKSLKARALYQGAGDATEALFSSLVDQAFRGELTSTNGASKPQLGLFASGKAE